MVSLRRPHHPPIFGQVVVGPPGSGKTVYCDGMQQYLRLLGRDAWVINLDPANEGRGKKQNSRQKENSCKSEAEECLPGDAEPIHKNQLLPYDTLFDAVQDAVSLMAVMEGTGLGPNGGLLYCMEYMEAHSVEITQMIEDRVRAQQNSSSQPPYLIFDFPGQVELYTHSTCVQSLMENLSAVLDLRLTAVQLIDAQYCTDAGKYLSAALLGTTTMLRLELPMVNVLSKIDILYHLGELPMQLEFFTECHDLNRLIPFVDSQPSSVLEEDEEGEFSFADDPEYQAAVRRRRQSRFYSKYSKLHAAMAEVVDDYGLLSFLPLSITSAESVGRVLGRIDKCNGYVFTNTSRKGEESSSVQQDIFQCALQSDNTYESLSDVQEHITARNRGEVTNP